MGVRRLTTTDNESQVSRRQASSSNDVDGYADDLAAVIEALDLQDATVIGHSTGGGEVALLHRPLRHRPGRQSGPDPGGAAGRFCTAAVASGGPCSWQRPIVRG